MQYICKACLPEVLHRIAEEVETDNHITLRDQPLENWSVGENLAWHIVSIYDCPECAPEEKEQS